MAFNDPFGARLETSGGTVIRVSSLEARGIPRLPYSLRSCSRACGVVTRVVTEDDVALAAWGWIMAAMSSVPAPRVLQDFTGSRRRRSRRPAVRMARGLDPERSIQNCGGPRIDHSVQVDLSASPTPCA
jgi:hypothetical protein